MANDVGSPSALRRANERRLLEALSSHGPATQAALARITGLSRQAVNNLVHSMQEKGQVNVGPSSNAKEFLISLPLPDGVLVGFDVGHEGIRALLVSLKDGVRFSAAADLEVTDGIDEDLDTIVYLLDDLLGQSGFRREDVVRVGVAIHAPFDVAADVTGPTSIMSGWSGYRVSEEISSRLGLDVVVDNDANTAALAEKFWGAGVGYPDFVYVKAGEGLGAGIISSSQPFHGGTGMAGEIGHLLVDSRGPLCNCGNRGCLSAVASGRSLIRQMEELGYSQITLEGLVDAALAGEVTASRVIAEAGRNIGLALSHVVNILGPRRIVIGGDLANAGDVLLDPIRLMLQSNTVVPVGKGTDLTQGKLYGQASLLGAIALALGEDHIGPGGPPNWAANEFFHEEAQLAQRQPSPQSSTAEFSSLRASSPPEILSPTTTRSI